MNATNSLIDPMPICAINLYASVKLYMSLKRESPDEQWLLAVKGVRLAVEELEAEYPHIADKAEAYVEALKSPRRKA